MKLSKEQRDILASGFIELANIAVAALVFANILSEKPSIAVSAVGILFYLLLLSLALYLKRGGNK